MAVVNEPSVFEPLKFYCIVREHMITSSISTAQSNSHKMILIDI